MSGVYMDRLLRAFKDGIIDKGSVGLADIYHDQWCGHNKGRDCDCDPEIVWRTADGGVTRLRADGFLEESP